MQGSLRKRGSTWELRVHVGRDSVTGRKRYVSRTYRGTKREAQRALAEMVVEADELGRSRSRSTVGDLLDEWFAHASPDFSPSTVKETRADRSSAICDRRSERPMWRSCVPTTSTASTDRCAKARARAASRSSPGRSVAST